jgi:Ca2+-transporting ATPase
VILIVAAVTTAIGVISGRDLLLMVETGIALFVAAVPEGLPVVASIALARGMWRLARRNALIERLGAVETLGGVNVICTDETGTLTENRMTLRRILLAGEEVEIVDGELRRGDQPISMDDGSPLHLALEVGALCTTAELTPGEDAAGRGDPMEVALLAGAETIGVDLAALAEKRPEIRIEPFDPEVMMMATFHCAGSAWGGDLPVAVKGAPEVVLDHAIQILTEEGERPLDDAERDAWRQRNERLAAAGLRALALAHKRVDD